MTAETHLNGQITLSAVKNGQRVKLIYCGYTLEEAKASFKRELQKL